MLSTLKQKGLLCNRKGGRPNVHPFPQEAPLMRLSVATLRQVVKGDLRIEFRRHALSSYSGLEFLRRYGRRRGLAARLRTACAEISGDYGSARLALLVLALFYA